MTDDGESDHEEARVSRNLFDLFEQADSRESSDDGSAGNG